MARSCLAVLYAQCSVQRPASAVSTYGHTRRPTDNSASGVHPSSRLIGGWEGGGPGGPTKLKASGAWP
eukprot:scaffold2363_cov132-Isochrysis_galbana.AAC.2